MSGTGVAARQTRGLYESARRGTGGKGASKGEGWGKCPPVCVKGACGAQCPPRWRSAEGVEDVCQQGCPACLSSNTEGDSQLKRYAGSRPAGRDFVLCGESGRGDLKRVSRPQSVSRTLWVKLGSKDEVRVSPLSVLLICILLLLQSSTYNNSPQAKYMCKLAIVLARRLPAMKHSQTVYCPVSQIPIVLKLAYCPMEDPQEREAKSIKWRSCY